jgi:hypothetical protein
MPGTPLTFEFVAPVLRLETGLKQHYVPLPAEVADALQTVGARRVIATLNGRTLSRGVQGRKDGEKYLMISLALMREMRASYGDMVMVSLEPDPDPDTIELCEEFRAALEQDAEAAERFYAFPPSKQRGIAYYVDSARRVETRVLRALEMARKLRTFTLYGDRNDA